LARQKERPLVLRTLKEKVRNVKRKPLIVTDKEVFENVISIEIHHPDLLNLSRYLGLKEEGDPF
jgi:hypothetical protein